MSTPYPITEVRAEERLDQVQAYAQELADLEPIIPAICMTYQQMFDAAAEHGLIVIQRCGEVRLSSYIPPGWHRAALVIKPAGTSLAARIKAEQTPCAA